MPKNIVQDVIPGVNRRSIREVLPSRGSKTFKETAPSKTEEDVVLKAVRDTYQSEKEEKARSFRNGFKKNTSRVILWSISVISIIALMVTLGNIFSVATLTVTPQSQKVTINLDLVAKPKTVTGELSYNSLALVRDKEEIVPADGEKPVESRSSGRIVIYNSYSTSPQRLVKNTRFETPEGLIYKIADSVTVPGRKNLDEQNIPGSVEALVYGETAGEEYNIGLTDFTIPGFKSNTERFNSFYGRSKTPMTGGKIGTEKVVSNEKMIQAKARLESSLTQELLAEAKKLAPETSVFYDTAYRVDFEPVLSGAVVKGNNVAIRERAYFTAFLIKRDELVRAVADNVLDGSKENLVDIINVDGLDMEMKTKGKYSATSVGPIEFNLKGEAVLVWRFDEGSLKSDLIAKSKSGLGDIVSKYPAIVKADVTIRPFWKRVFPSNPSKIGISYVESSD